MKKSTRGFGRTVLLGAISTGMVLTTLVAVSPTASAAYRLECFGNEHTTITSRKDYTEIDTGDSQTFYNGSSSTHYNVTKNYSYTASTKATTASSSKTEVSAGLAVGWFNAAAKYKTGTTDAMETGMITTVGFKTDFNVPPYTRVMQYAGHRVTKAYLVHDICIGGWRHVQWQGTVIGPRFPESGVIDCKKTNWC